VRFDQRGTGLSDWDTDRISTEAMREDMEAVVDASGLDRFAIFAASQGGAFAIDYALAHPERVSCIVFLGSYLRGRNRRDDAEETALYETALTMIRQGWGSPNALFRQFFISSFVPSASAELQGAFDELQRISSSSENTQRIFRMNAGVDLTDRAGRLRVPVLVMHARDDRVSPIDESRRLARAIPGARFVELPGDNHVVLEGTPAFELFFQEASSFIAAQA
jgi:pimeloyl-ACP methyl ester carboxylesterase